MRLISVLTILFYILMTPNSIVAQKTSGYVIKGNIRGLANETKIYLTTQQHDTIQYTISRGSQFTFKGKLNPDGRFVFIHFDTMVTKISLSAVFIHNNAVIEVRGTIGNSVVQVGGSTPQKEYEKIQNVYKLYGDTINDLHRKLNEIGAKKFYQAKTEDTLGSKTKEEGIAKLSSKISATYHRMDAAIINWIKENNNSLFAPYLVSTGLAKPALLPQMIEIYKDFPSKIKKSYYGQILQKEIASLEFTSQIKQGSEFPDLTLEGVKGDSVNIISLIKANKLTLIDCWASWCRPCRDQIPELSRVYSKYKNMGFNIIGVSSDTKKASWLKAVNEDKTLWDHLLEDKVTSITKIFKLQSIPAYILVDKEGRIVAFHCSMSTIPNFGGSLSSDLEKTIEKYL